MTVSFGTTFYSKTEAYDIRLDADLYVDDSLLAELRASGFFETLQKKYGKL